MNDKDKKKKHLPFPGIKAISSYQYPTETTKKDTRYHLICQQNQLFPNHNSTGLFPKKERNTDILLQASIFIYSQCTSQLIKMYTQGILKAITICLTCKI